MFVKEILNAFAMSCQALLCVIVYNIQDEGKFLSVFVI